MVPAFVGMTFESRLLGVEGVFNPVDFFAAVSLSLDQEGVETHGATGILAMSGDKKEGGFCQLATFRKRNRVGSATVRKRVAKLDLDGFSGLWRQHRLDHLRREAVTERRFSILLRDPLDRRQ